MMYLVDTSVWIETFKRHDPLDLEKIVDFEQVVTCLPIVQEVLQGFRDEKAFRHAKLAMLSLPMVCSPMKIGIFEHAIDLYRSARRMGMTVRSSIDCLISACAIENDLCVLHRDRDYPQIAKASGLREQSI